MRLHSFPISPEFVPKALQTESKKPILLSDLAVKLDVDPARLLPLIEHKYLTVISADPPTVYEPPPAAMRWLATMFTPLVMRPFIPIAMAADIEGFAPNALRALCLDYDVPLYLDPAFGEIMSVAAFFKLHECLHHYREPSRFDRQALLVAFLQAADPVRYREVIKPPRFSKRLEAEIQRVSDLPEPARTSAALRVYENLNAAEKVAEAITSKHGVKLTQSKNMKRVRSMVMADEMPPS